MGIMEIMNAKEQLQKALKDAMRANDLVGKRTIRMALSAIQLAEVETRKDLDDSAVFAILQKEIKSREESIQDAKKAARPDLVDEAQDEIAVLKKFLPEQVSQDELEAIVRETIQEVGASSMREMGEVMKVLIPRLQGRATGSQASEVVRKLLA
jgi:uncharacterized protein